MLYHLTNIVIASLLWTLILGSVALAAWGIVAIAGSHDT